MTRRTPKPGDSFTRGLMTLRIVSVHENTVVFDASWTKYEGTFQESLTDFHERIATATWGSK
jgi:hypothetical protein